MTRRGHQRPEALASVAIRLLLPQGQPDTNEEIFAWKTLAWSTPPFPSVPACLMAFAVQQVPSAM